MCKGGGWGVGGGSTSIMWVMCPLRPPPKTSLRHLARPKVSALTFPGIIVTRGLDLVALFPLEGDTPFLNSHPLPQTFNVVASVLRVNFHRFLRQKEFKCCSFQINARFPPAGQRHLLAPPGSTTRGPGVLTLRVLQRCLSLMYYLQRYLYNFTYLITLLIYLFLYLSKRAKTF